MTANPLRLLSLAALGAAVVLGASAFSYGDVSPRAVVATISGDASAYVAIAANGASPHRCFVSETSAGRLVLSFGAPASPCDTTGGGGGLNAGDPADATRITRYAFHDLLVVTNKGTVPAQLWVNATTTSGGGSAIHVARATTLGTMADADYSAATPDGAPALLAVGASAYVGVRLEVGTLESGQTVAGQIELVVRAQ